MPLDTEGARKKRQYEKILKVQDTMSNLEAQHNEELLKEVLSPSF